MTQFVNPIPAIGRHFQIWHSPTNAIDTHSLTPYIRPSKAEKE